MSRSSGFCTPSTISLLRAICFFHHIVLLVCWLLSNGPSGHRTTKALVAAGVSGSLDALLLLQGLVEPRPARARRDRAAHASRRLRVSRHLKKTVLAREILDAFLACVGPGVPVRVLLDSGGVVRDVVRGLPKNLVFFGAIRISAARYAPLTAPWGVRRKGNSLYGLRLDSYSFVPGGYFFSKRNAPPVTA